MWRLPSIGETIRPDRVRLLLPMVSVLPEGSVERLRDPYGGALGGLTGVEVQALVTAEVEGCVSNSRMQEMSDQHPADLTRLLQGLVGKGLLRQDGQKRGTVYRLNTSVGSAEPDSLHRPGDSLHRVIDSLHRFEELPKQEQERLRTLAEPARRRPRLSTVETQEIVASLCKGLYLTKDVLGELMHRNPGGVRDRILTPMVRAGLLAYRYDGEPNHPQQSYITVEE